MTTFGGEKVMSRLVHQLEMGRAQILGEMVGQNPRERKVREKVKMGNRVGAMGNQGPGRRYGAFVSGVNYNMVWETILGII